MPDDENTETMMNGTPLDGSAFLKAGAKNMERGRQVWKGLLSAGYQFWGVPEPLADLSASLQTLTFR